MSSNSVTSPHPSESKAQAVTAPKKEIQYNLEALRGVAALIVVWSHAFVFPKFLDPNYAITGPFSFEPPARISVFLFFVLSGYVIGISNKQALTKGTIGKYIKKRLLRIYPIYFLSMLFTIMIAKAYPISTIWGNMTLTQVLLTPLFGRTIPAGHCIMKYFIICCLFLCHFSI
ncbi:acyltransferase [Hymenobacter sp. BT188]|nr:acyltransferase [Hymenobacter sp. BT188]